MWYDLIKSLRDYLRMQEPRPARYIEGGALDPDNMDLGPDSNSAAGAIFLIRDSEPNDKILMVGGQRSEGEVIFFAENWIRDDDPDPMTGYKKLSEQEDRFTSCLKPWVIQFNQGLTGLQLTSVELDETIGDADSKRPILGSRKTIRIKWSKNT